MRSSSRSTVLSFFVAVSITSGCGTDKPAEPPPPIESAVPVTRAASKPSGTVAERIDKAKKALADGDAEAAIVVLDEAVLIDAVNRDLLGMLVQAYTVAADKAETTDPAKFYRYNVTCGGYMRELRDKFQNHTEDEKKLIMSTLRNEATAHAKSRRIEETTGSLRELKGAGFTDFESLRKEPDFAEFLKVEQFAKSFEEIAAGK